MSRIAGLEKLHRAYDEFDEMPDDEVMARKGELDEKEEQFFASQKYEAFRGDAQQLEAADLHNKQQYDALQKLKECHYRFEDTQQFGAFGGDPEKLKVADFHNDFGEGEKTKFHLYDMCQAGLPGGGKRGAYMPSCYWAQPNQKMEILLPRRLATGGGTMARHL